MLAVRFTIGTTLIYYIGVYRRSIHIMHILCAYPCECNARFHDYTHTHHIRNIWEGEENIRTTSTDIYIFIIIFHFILRTHIIIRVYKVCICAFVYGFQKPRSDTYIIHRLFEGGEFLWGPIARVTYSRIGGCRSITSGRPNGKKKSKKLNYKGMISQCSRWKGKGD